MKTTKRITSLVLVVIMVLYFIPSAFAQITGDNFVEGDVLVGFHRNVEKVQDIAPELSIERVELAQMDNDYVPYINTANFRFVKVTLTQKTKQATLDAIELFKTKPSVVVAEPFYTVYSKYNPGDVIVSLDLGSNPSVIRNTLKDYEIESIRLLTPGSDTQNVYCITFVEKTKEIVAEVLPILKSCDKIRIAEPNFIGEFTVEPIKGDADSDLKVTIMDATAIQKYLARSITGSAIDCAAAAVSNNYVLSVIDATLIQKKLAGIEAGF